MDMLSSLKSHREKNFFARNFSPITPGGIRSSVFTLFSGTVGAGVLSLPHITSYFGLVLGCVLIIVAAYMNYCSYMLLNEAVVSSKKKSYPNICSYYLGEWYAKIFTYILFMTNFMACTIYTTISWGFMESLLSDYVDLPIKDSATGTFDEYDSTMWMYRGGIMLGAATLMLLINLRKEFSGLRYVSVLILAAILLTILVAAIQTPEYYRYFSIMQQYEVKIMPPKPDPNWITGLATIFMSYGCHPVFFYLRSELIHKTEKRVRKVIASAIGTECVLYLIISIAGYISLGENLTPGIYTLRKSIPGHKDLFMKSMRWVFVVVTLLHVPINMFATRDQIYTTFKKKRTKSNHILFSCGITYVAFLVPIVWPNVIAVLGFFGGVFATTVCLAFPFLIGVRMREKEGKSGAYHYKMIICFVVFIIIASAYLSLFPNVVP